MLGKTALPGSQVFLKKITGLTIFNLRHFRGYTEFPNLNLSQIGQVVRFPPSDENKLDGILRESQNLNIKIYNKKYYKYVNPKDTDSIT